MTRQLSSLLTKTQASEMKICSMLIHVLFLPKLYWYLPNPGRTYWIHKTTVKMNALALLFVIKFASSDTDSGTTPVEGYVHDYEKIRLKRWLPMNHSDLPELLQTSSPDPYRRRRCGRRRLQHTHARRTPIPRKTSKWKCLFMPNEGKLFYEGRWWDGWPALSRWSIWKSSRYAPAAISPVTSHETVIRFYDEISREEPLNGKRRLEIYLALGDSEDVVGKAGRPKGSTKAARAAAEGRAAAIPNHVWHDSDLTICSQIERKADIMFESHIETCIDWTSFDFRFSIFLAICNSNFNCLKLILYFVPDLPSITQSRTFRP